MEHLNLVLKYLDVVICLALVTLGLHLSKTSQALLGIVRCFLGDYEVKTKQMEQVLREEKDEF